MKKGDKVLYEVRGSQYSAYIRTAHKDGSFTVELYFPLRDGIEARYGFQGMKFRVSPSFIEPF
jgi:hypothetical protein